jgi:hypothetical protein
MVSASSIMKLIMAILAQIISFAHSTLLLIFTREQEYQGAMTNEEAKSPSSTIALSHCTTNNTQGV